MPAYWSRASWYRNGLIWQRTCVYIFTTEIGFSWQDFVQVLFYPFLGGLVSWHFKNDEIVIQTRTKEREFWFILNNKIFFCNLCLLNSVVFFFENCGKWNFLCPVGEKPKRNNTIPWLTLHIWRSNFDCNRFWCNQNKLKSILIHGGDIELSVA